MHTENLKKRLKELHLFIIGNMGNSNKRFAVAEVQQCWV